MNSLLRLPRATPKSSIGSIRTRMSPPAARPPTPYTHSAHNTTGAAPPKNAYNHTFRDHFKNYQPQLLLVGLSFGLCVLGVENIKLRGVINELEGEGADGKKKSKSKSVGEGEAINNDVNVLIKREELSHLSSQISNDSSIYIMEELSSSWLGSGQLTVKGVDNIAERIKALVEGKVGCFVDGVSIVPVGFVSQVESGDVNLIVEGDGEVGVIAEEVETRMV